MSDGIYFLIHCKTYSERLGSARKALMSVCQSFTLVDVWDGNDISCSQFITDDQEHAKLWSSRLEWIKNILIANTTTGEDVAYTDALENATKYTQAHPNYIPSWMAARRLTRGEISVLLKHYFALSSIACGMCEWGLIAEDDIIETGDTAEQFQACIREFEENNTDYMDLAGGCGLKPEVTDPALNSQQVFPARTRTNACYIVSKHLAAFLVESFWPLVYPIDWHLQALMTFRPETRCRWTLNPPFIHGSESGHYRSWRTNV